MIKLNKPSIPVILKTNASNWTTSLLNACSQYGGYSKIPKEEKESLIKHYRNKEIQDVLFTNSNNKCAFCESIPGDSGFLEIEHFHPKSLYPSETFDWNNLLPACKKCNISKSDFDTKQFPIVNPYIDDPNDYFEYNNLRIIPTSNCLDLSKAERTIEECDLNSNRLFKPRSEILVSFHNYENSLITHIKEINESNTERKKQNKIKKLMESLDIIENLISPNKNYSEYCNALVKNSSAYNEAKHIINNHLASL